MKQLKNGIRETLPENLILTMTFFENFRKFTGYDWRDAFLGTGLFSPLFSVFQCMEHCFNNLVKHVLKYLVFEYSAKPVRVGRLHSSIPPVKKTKNKNKQQLVILAWIYEQIEIPENMGIPNFMKRHIKGFITDKKYKTIPHRYAFVIFVRFAWWFQTIVPANLKTFLQNLILVGGLIFNPRTKTPEECKIVADKFMKCFELCMCLSKNKNNLSTKDV